MQSKTSVNVYLAFNGNCEEAFNFYKSIFGGEYSYLGRFGDMPAQEGMPAVPESDRKLILHVALPISKETVLMGSDTTESFGKKVNFGNNFSLSVQTDNTAEADRLFTALSEGGKVLMPMGVTFWGAYYGLLTDKFGISWMLNVELGQPA